MICTLAEIKTALGISDTSEDAFLTRQGQLVSDAIEAYCKRRFLTGTYTQTFYADEHEPSKELVLAAFPVASITSVTVDNVVMDSSEYRLNPAAGILIRPYGWHRCTKTVVVYAAGYAQGSIPSNVKEVVYNVVGERRSKKNAGIDLNFGSDVQRISIPGTISVDFDYTLANNDRTTPFGSIIGNYLNVLDFYRSDRAVVGAGRLEYVAVS